MHTSSRFSQQQMEDRMASLLEQKIYLGDQLKSIMKRNRVLKAEIEYASQYAKTQIDAKFNLADDDDRSTASSQPSEYSFDNKGRVNRTKSLSNLNITRNKSRGRRRSPNNNRLSQSHTWSHLPKSPFAVLSPIDKGGTGKMPGNGLLECSSMQVEEKQNERSKKLLDELLAAKSPIEEHLERTISEIFTELKNRKNESAKRASIKRFPELVEGNV